MKIVKTASNKIRISLSKKEWQEIGKKAQYWDENEGEVSRGYKILNSLALLAKKANSEMKFFKNIFNIDNRRFHPVKYIIDSLSSMIEEIRNNLSITSSHIIKLEDKASVTPDDKTLEGIEEFIKKCDKYLILTEKNRKFTLERALEYSFQGLIELDLSKLIE
jgi:hypothetical protein